MADLRDNIRLETSLDAQALLELVNQFKDLKIKVSEVAAASRFAAEVQKQSIREVLAAEKVAEAERDGRSERRRLNKIANIKAETEAELGAIRISDAASKASYNQQIRDMNLYNAELRKKSLETREAEKSTNGLRSSMVSLSGIRSQLIALFGAYSVGAFAEQMVQAQSKVESFELSMKNLLGAGYGGKLVNDLKQFTVQTPLNFEQVIDATNTLVGSFKAAGASSATIGKEVPQILESLGNSAAALGGENRLGRLIYAFSQVQAIGRLMGTEVRQITETGFPLLAVMAEKSGKSVQQLQKDISDGKVSFAQFKEAILSAGSAGGVFAGSMDIMANTVQGRLDKLKETFFFASARIGDALSESAKNAINFADSILKGLFGTDQATARTIEYVKQLGILYATYKTIVNYETAMAAGKRILNTLELAGNVIRTQSALIVQRLAGNTTTLAIAEVEATAATTAFNRALSANTLGIVITLIGAAVGAYELYKANVEDAISKNDELNKKVLDGITPLKESQARFNSLANAVRDTNIPLEEKVRRLDNLKKMYPDQLKGINDLAKAEEILKGKNLEGNSAVDYRKEKLAQLKREFPNFLKGVTDLTDAEAKLGKILNNVNADYAIRMKLIDIEIRTNINREKLTKNTRELVELEGKLAKASAESRVIYSENGSFQVYDSERQEIQKNIDARKRYSENFQKEIDKAYSYQKSLTAKLKYEYEEDDKNKTNFLKDGKEKALKYQSETNAQKLIMDEIVAEKELELNREREAKLLNLQASYDRLRVNNAIGSSKQKSEKLTEIENKLREDLADSNRKWNAKDKAQAIKDEKEKNKEIEREAKTNAENLWKVIVDRLEDEQKAREKAAKEEKDFQEDVSKETIKIKTSEQKFKDKLLLLENISKAKFSKEIQKIENETNSNIIKSAKDRNLQETALIKAKLDYLKENGKDQTQEYRDLYLRFLKLQEEYNNASTDLLDEEIEAVKKNIKKKEDLFKGLVDATQKVVDSVFDDLGKGIDEAISKTDNSLDKFFLERKKKDLAEVKSFVSIASKAVSGDISGAVSESVVLLFNVVKDTFAQQAQWEKAVLERQTQLYKEYATTAKAAIASILGNISNVTNLYENIIPKSFVSVKNGAGQYITQLQYQYKLLTQQSDKLDEIANNLGSRGYSAMTFFEMETKYAEDLKKLYQSLIDEENQRYQKQIESINKTYEASKQSEKDSFDTKKENIEKTYNDEIKRVSDLYNANIKAINDRYSYEQTLANQRYDADTLNILKQGSIQLEALIKNEEALNSVRNDYANKRKFILDTYALANKQITADMSQEEIDGINAAIKARDEALVKLEKQYNTELQYIVNSEGQKRKEYTETEKIQNEIDERLSQLAIKYDAAEIERNANKNILLKQEQDKKDKAEEEALALKTYNLLEIETLYYANIQKLDDDYRANINKAQEDNKNNLIKINADMERDLTESYTRLVDALSSEISRYASLLSSINDKTTQEYKALQEELQKLIDKYRELTGVAPTITTVEVPAIVRQPRGFASGTDDTTSYVKSMPKADSMGGAFAIIHDGESIFKKSQMDEMTSIMGKRPTRDEVIERFKLGTKFLNTSFTQNINPFVTNKANSDNTLGVEIKTLNKKIEKLTNEVVKKGQPIINIDKSGFSTRVASLNSQIDKKNNKFAY